ncbi:DUF1707 SHOCT-like domain-containing protein [Pseudonocardia sp. TRM90224]|uniref:DUF1707 SHOCT-like domain-containing protein n=1 Tax=Pseudonocardia sp. TRM90224 TaxID=2812678 RepID=UPI001E41DA74|nr:DUF1707 domain-containing protein [Pseudonocardia sp. TRM90224]
MNTTKDISPHTVRVSDDEREVVATRIRDAAAEGRLTLEEADERQVAAYAARTADDLAALTTDLPEPPPQPPAPKQLSSAARTRLAVHAVLVGILVVAMITRWVMGPVPFFWPAFPMFWLGLSVLVHHRIARRRA